MQAPSTHRRSSALFGRAASVSAAVAILAASCAEPSAPGSPSAASTSPATATTEPSPTVNFLEPTVPLEIAGVWRRSVGGVTVDLTLQVGYTIQQSPGERGSGQVTVEGDAIEFYGSNLCEGSGDYTWTVEGDVLTFTMIGTDPCSGRSDVLVPGSFRRYDP